MVSDVLGEGEAIIDGLAQLLIAVHLCGQHAGEIALDEEESVLRRSAAAVSCSDLVDQNADLVFVGFGIHVDYYTLVLTEVKGPI
jgi:hypothetical protein